MDMITWESLLPIKDIFGEELPKLDMAGIDLATDVYQTPEGVTVEMQLPGIKADAYDVKVEKGMLVVSGKRDKTLEVKEENYYHKEIQRGSFERRVKLPDAPLRTEALSTTIENGTLKLFIPKA